MIMTPLKWFSNCLSLLSFAQLDQQANFSKKSQHQEVSVQYNKLQTYFIQLHLGNLQKYF